MGATKSPLTFLSASFLSSVLCVRLPKISRVTFDSKVRLFLPFKKLQKPTWWDCLKTPIFVPFTPSVLPSCPRISSWHVVFEEKGPRVGSLLALVWLFVVASLYLLG